MANELLRDRTLLEQREEGGERWRERRGESEKGSGMELESGISQMREGKEEMCDTSIPLFSAFRPKCCFWSKENLLQSFRRRAENKERERKKREEGK